MKILLIILFFSNLSFANNQISLPNMNEDSLILELAKGGFDVYSVLDSNKVDVILERQITISAYRLEEHMKMVQVYVGNKTKQDLSSFEVEMLGMGQDRIAYRIGDYVIKISVENIKQSRREVQFYDYEIKSKKRKIDNVAELFYSSEDHEIMILEYLDGEIVSRNDLDNIKNAVLTLFMQTYDVLGGFLLTDFKLDNFKKKNDKIYFLDLGISSYTNYEMLIKFYNIDKYLFINSLINFYLKNLDNTEFLNINFIKNIKFAS
jgi:hypothetical protein